METLNTREILQTINNIEKQLKHIKKQLLEEIKDEKINYKAFVYCHILPNNKYYIGIAKDLKSRWKDGTGYKRNKKFYDAINEYGWDKIKHLILYKCQDYSDAKCLEMHLICLFGACEYGYNQRSSLGQYLTNSRGRQEMERNFNNMVANFKTKANEENIKKLSKIYTERGREYENSQ